MIGRSKEIELIRAAVESVVNGPGQVLLLAGEAGIGKSTLARRTAEIAVRKGMAVYWGFAWEAGGAPSYWPWTQLLRSLIDDHEPTDTEKAALSLLMPELAGGAGASAELQPDQARFQLLESVRMLLARVSARTPLLLLFEDLHAADKDTLNLLRHLARHVSAMPVLILGTYREIEARTSTDAEPLWQLGRESTVLRPSRLSPEEVAEYLQRRTGSAPATGELQDWYETTSGNPLFLTELAVLLDRERGGARVDRLPETVEQVIRQHIERLPAPVNRMLAAASVLGNPFSADALEYLAGEKGTQLSRLLEEAARAGVVVPEGAGEFSFSHGLYREVLYRRIPPTDRSMLHLRHAEALRKRVQHGDPDGWSELATHLAAAGSDHREEAIEAWRHAADRACARLAFDDAAALLATAVRSFGEGPKFDPGERCRLLIDCAQAMLLAGDIEAGHATCEEAFGIAATLEDTDLMAASALTYGSAIVVASIDQTLVNMLRECLEALPEEEAPMRARILARLAAALQPAPDPCDPMDMARDAIAQAREIGDEEVLYDVLRNAISALMDFAPPDERRALNREFLELATGNRDLPAQFRCHIRLMIDAAEVADREAFDQAIDACEDIAARIGLPHYCWRAASARAMQAIIEGRYADASACIDQAQAMADQIDDMEPCITLPIQRFAVMHDWDSARTMTVEEIQAQLDDAYARGMGEARAFVQPFLAAFTVTTREEARKLIENPAFVKRSFAGNDRFSMAAVGMLAVMAEDPELVQKVFDALLPFDRGCAVTGLMGSVWCGPVAFELARLSLALGKHDQAGSFLETALDIAQRMRSQPFVARTEFLMSRLAAETGDQEGARRHERAARDLIAALEMRPPPGLDVEQRPGEGGEARRDHGFSISPRGEVFEVSLDGRRALVKSSKGMEMLTLLVGKPDTEVHVLELSGAGPTAVDDNPGPALDPKARAEYRQRVEELREELEEAEASGDFGRTASLKEELDFIARELSRAFGLGGRERPQGRAAERARVNVRRRIKDAIERIDEQLPGARRYLENTIKTGSYCKYTPM